MKVTYISKAAKDGTRWTVEQMLEDALSQVKEHRITPSKALVVFLDDEDKYDVAFMQSGMSMSQSIALIEILKSVFLSEMGY